MSDIIEGERQETIVRLYEEKLAIDRSTRKVGEVVIRKEIETETIEVPIYKEKLIIERLEDGTTRLAEVELGRTKIKGDALDGNNSVKAQFNDLYLAAEMLKTFARQGVTGYRTISIEFVLEDERTRDLYRQFLESWSR